eukprot:3266985-Pleurochrysis_carterae.AAC.1
MPCVTQSDKCGDDSLYLPCGGGRLSSANQSRYTYRVSLQDSHIFGKLWELTLILPMLKTGANFGAATFLTSIIRLMRNNELQSEKRRLVRATDVRFASAHRSALPSPQQCTRRLVVIAGRVRKCFFCDACAPCYARVLVHRGVFDDIVWARLPPDHTHDAID